jgi:hypothetical protein
MGTAEASVLTPGENPGQYQVQVYIRNESDLPYPSEGMVGDGFIQYESEWLDRQLDAWSAWVTCEDHGGGDACDEFYYAIEANTWDLDTITFDMLDLIVDARFEMYGVTFDESDITYWTETIGGGRFGFESVGTIFEMADGANSIYFGAGDDVYHPEIRLNGHYGDNDNGYCYAQDPDGSWTQDLCYDMSVDPVATTIPEPATLALVGIGLFGLRITRRRIRMDSLFQSATQRLEPARSRRGCS